MVWCSFRVCRPFPRAVLCCSVYSTPSQAVQQTFSSSAQWCTSSDLIFLFIVYYFKHYYYFIIVLIIFSHKSKRRQEKAHITNMYLPNPDLGSSPIAVSSFASVAVSWLDGVDERRLLRSFLRHFQDSNFNLTP